MPSSPLWIAIRSLSRRPAIAGVALVSLAVGVAVNTAVFSIVDAVYLRPPAVRAPESLVEITGSFKDSGSAILDWPDCREIANHVPAFSEVTASMGRGGSWRNSDETLQLLLYAVGDNYFDMLGVKPYLGRLPGARDAAEAGSEPPIVLAYWFWREKMGGRTNVIGERMQFRDHLWRIAAVLPPQFRGLSTMDQRHVWIPASGWARYYRDDMERGGGQFKAIARLRPGVSLEQAQAQLEPLARNLERSDSRVPRGRRLVATSLGREMRSRLRPGAAVMGVVSLVLLIACANVAAVLLAYAEARRREIGLRVSLGASPWALARQFLTESVVLTVAGASVGLLLASWMLSAVPAFAPPSQIPLNFDFRIDIRVLLFTAACLVVTLVVFNLIPLRYALRVSPAEALAGARTLGRRPQSWLRHGLVAAQVALSVVLVGGALVLARSLGDTNRIYPGFDTSRHLALAWAYVPDGGARMPEQQRFGEAARRIAGVGGVEAVTYARHLPLVASGAGAAVSVTPEGAASDATPPRVYFNLVGPDYFEIVGTRMTAGRVFTAFDHHGGAPVVIVSVEAAKRFWPGQNPLGKTLRIQKSTYAVVGVTADGRISELYERPAPAVYLPGSRMEWGETILIARTKPDPGILLKDIARAAGGAGSLRVYDSMTLTSLMREAVYSDWIPTVLGGLLAMIGLLLAGCGLYGAASYAAEQRLGEYAVRMAIGARSAQIAAMALRQAALPCVVAVPFGVGLLIVAHRHFGATMLHDRPLDAIALCAGAVIAVTAVLAGAVFPALRAARLDPVEALRSE